jgi:hypothetical protein
MYAPEGNYYLYHRDLYHRGDIAMGLPLSDPRVNYPAFTANSTDPDPSIPPAIEKEENNA